MRTQAQGKEQGKEELLCCSALVTPFTSLGISKRNFTHKFLVKGTPVKTSPVDLPAGGILTSFARGLSIRGRHGVETKR